MIFAIGPRDKTNDLLVTSKNETTNSPIHEVLHKGQRAFYYFEKHIKPCFFNIKRAFVKGFKIHFAALQIRELLNWRIRGFVFLMSRTGYKIIR